MPTVRDAINAYERLGIMPSYLDRDVGRYLHQPIASAQPTTGFYQASGNVVVEERLISGSLSGRKGFVRVLHVRTRIE